MLKIGVVNIEKMRGFILFIPFGDLVQRSFQKGFYVCIELKNFLRTFLTKLRVNCELTKTKLGLY